ncbi:MAG: hypothetical protein JWN48_674 [Myxococcaceae bacterium]|nr:hypothetical protein [Myxococcaceae bacterium]
MGPLTGWGAPVLSFWGRSGYWRDEQLRCSAPGGAALLCAGGLDSQVASSAALRARARAPGLQPGSLRAPSVRAVCPTKQHQPGLRPARSRVWPPRLAPASRSRVSLSLCSALALLRSRSAPSVESYKRGLRGPLRSGVGFCSRGDSAPELTSVRMKSVASCRDNRLVVAHACEARVLRRSGRPQRRVLRPTERPHGAALPARAAPHAAQPHPPNRVTLGSQPRKPSPMTKIS